jgi:hypothetical protein
VATISPTPAPKPPRAPLTQRQSRLLLIAGILVALLIVGFFAFRLTRRVGNRPTFEPVAAWMSVPYVGRAYGMRRDEIDQLYRAIDATPPARGPNMDGPDRKPIGDIAREQGKEPDALVLALQTYLDARPRQGPRNLDIPEPPLGGRPTRQP